MIPLHLTGPFHPTLLAFWCAHVWAPVPPQEPPVYDPEKTALLPVQRVYGPETTQEIPRVPVPPMVDWDEDDG